MIKMASVCIKQFIFLCPNTSFTTYYFNLCIDNIYLSNRQFCFFNSYVYKRSADILWALHIVINSINEIIAIFLLCKYLFHLTVHVPLHATGIPITPVWDESQQLLLYCRLYCQTSEHGAPVYQLILEFGGVLYSLLFNVIYHSVFKVCFNSNQPIGMKIPNKIDIYIYFTWEVTFLKSFILISIYL